MSFGKRVGGATAQAGMTMPMARGVTRTSAPVAAPTVADAQLPHWATASLADTLKVCAIMAGVLVLIVWAFGPELLRDRRLADTYIPDFSINVESGKCRNMLYLVSYCGTDFSYDDATGIKQKIATHQLYGLGSMGGKPMIPMRSVAEPEAVSTAVAVYDHLLNRTITFLVVVLLFGVGFLKTVWSLMAGRYIGGRQWTETYGAAPA
jgi:hypothetical protein